MKILYLAHRIPYPPNKGDKIRSFNEIKYLSNNHEIDLICFADKVEDLQFKKDLEKYCNRVFVLCLKIVIAKTKGIAYLTIGKPISVGYFYHRKLQAKFDDWLENTKYGAIICFSSPMAEYVFRSKFLWPGKAQGSRFKAEGIQEEETDCPVPLLIMDYCDLDSDKWLQYAQHSRFPLNIVYRNENKRLCAYEKRINKHFDRSVFVSKVEADLFYSVYPDARNISVIPNGVDYDYFSFEVLSLEPSALSLHHPVLLFTGAMDYHANIDAVTWFYHEIFPNIIKEHPNVQFYIVGSNPAPNVKHLAIKNGVKVTGFVDDIRPYYNVADICVIPLRLARGVQNKVLEAMSMSRPVVTTSKAADGIKANSEKNLLVADEPLEFAAKVSSLLIDKLHREQLGINARQFVKKNYDWDINMNKLEEILHVNEHVTT